MITIPETLLYAIINAAQESNRKIIGVIIIPPESATGSYSFGFDYKDTAS